MSKETERNEHEPEDLPPPRDAEDGTREEDYELVEDDDAETPYADADEPLDEPIGDEDEDKADVSDVDDDEDYDEDVPEDVREAAAELRAVDPSTGAQLGGDLDVDEVEQDDQAAEVAGTEAEADTDVEAEIADAEADTDEAAQAELDAVSDEADAEQAAVSWYQNRWREIQISFVDEPRDAVANADRLVADVIHQLTNALVEQRNELAAEWNQDGASTEDLRRAFQGYRSFFERLVAT